MDAEVRLPDGEIVPGPAFGNRLMPRRGRGTRRRDGVGLGVLITATVS